MSELNESRWAVLSERGCEQTRLSYEEAAVLIARLRGERVHGLCVVTDEAASRLQSAKRVSKKSPAANNSKAAPKTRRSRKKNAS
jgi:hypothetical protein